IDAAMMVHPFGLDIADHPWLGVRQVDVVFHGAAAHAAMMPFMVRNALDALVPAYNSIALTPQHMLPYARVHGITTDYGSAPNGIPDRASGRFYVRSADVDTLTTLVERVQRIFESAAAATGTTVETDWNICPPYLPLRTN